MSEKICAVMPCSLDLHLAGANVDPDDEDDADLQDLLTSSAALIGKNLTKQKQRRKRAAAGSDDEELDSHDSEELHGSSDEGEDHDAGDIMYKDFFGDDPDLRSREDLSGSDQDLDHDSGDLEDTDPDHHGVDLDLAADESVPGNKGKAAAAAGRKRVHWDEGDVAGGGGGSDDMNAEEEQEEAPLSTHERRLLRMQVSLQCTSLCHDTSGLAGQDRSLTDCSLV